MKEQQRAEQIAAQRRQRPFQRRLGCRHYKPTDAFVPGCESGHDQAAMAGGRHIGMLTRLPCFGPQGIWDDGRLPCGGERATCADFSPWTEEEDRARHEEFEAMAARAVAPLAALSQVSTKRGAGGTIPCPNCQGRLNWSRSSYNGHMHAACETPGCFAMMQ